MRTKLKNVLIIDDDEPTVFLTKLLFETIDCTDNFYSCNDGREAIELLSQKDFEIPEMILLDINMPGMDGWEFLNEFDKISIKNKDKTKIYLVTTSIFEEDKKKAKDNKYIHSFLNKPITINSLNEI